MPTNHALLSPSSANRWLHCTAAPRLEAEIPETSSSFALEGTLAHAYCAKKLKSYLKLSTKDEDKEISDLKAEYHTGEMDEYTDYYCGIILERFTEARAHTPDAELFVEQPLDFGMYIPKSFGTSDAIIVADRCLDIFDFKYGKGVEVEAKDNPQIMIYALGAYEAFSLEYDIKEIRMSIVQPRLDNYSTYVMPVTALLAWAKKIKEAAQQAYKGGGPRVPGEWCQFCKVKNICKPLMRKCLDTVNDYHNPDLVTKEDMEKNVIPSIKTVKTWLAGIQSYVLDQALKGVQYKGYKLVEGKSNRRITDPKTVGNILLNLKYAKEDIFKPIELKPITELEKLCGKRTFDSLCSTYIYKPEGKATLVPESDKRPPYNSAIEDFASIPLSD